MVTSPVRYIKASISLLASGLIVSGLQALIKPLYNLSFNCIHSGTQPVLGKIKGQHKNAGLWTHKSPDFIYFLCAL
jgi:hypothetical protein